MDEARIGELGLSEGQRLLYLFDYGANGFFRSRWKRSAKVGSNPTSRRS